MPGVGKSLIGKQLAEKLGYKFIDPDDTIRELSGMSLQKTMEELGEEGYLDLEKKAIRTIIGPKNSVISPGGSVIYLEDSINFLKENSVLVFIHTTLDDLKKKFPDLEEREAIIRKQGRSFEELFKERNDLLEKYADITVSVPDRFDIAGVTNQIIENLPKLSIKNT